MASWKAKQKAIRSLEKNGKVRPEDLIEAARDPNHPCHNDFTWDVQQAAEERWWDQARALIRKCKFEVIYEEIGQAVCMYVPGSGEDEPVFVSVPKLRGQAKVKAMFAAELDQLHGIVARVCGLATAKSPILGAKVVHQLENMKRTLAALRSDLSD